MTALSKTSWELLESITSPFFNMDENNIPPPMEVGQLFKLIHLALPGEQERKVLEASVELLEKDGVGSGSSSSGAGGGHQQYHRSSVQEYKHATSKRCIWKVAGSTTKGAQYLCFKHYCSCPSYTQVAQRSHATTTTTTASPSSAHVASSGGVDTHVLCKHLLAVRLAKCLNMVESHTVDSVTFVTHCCSV